MRHDAVIFCIGWAIGSEVNRMDLKNNQITIRELMAHPQARAVLAKHFPQVIHLPIVTKSAGMTLERAMKLGAAFVPARSIRAALEELKQI